MMLLVVLAVPLAGALLLARWRGGLATAVHAVTAALTLAAALAVALAVHMDGVLTALDGFLRADALSAWMIMLIGLVDGLAATEAPRYASGRFYPLFHLFVFTMLLAVTTDDVGLMWVAIEGTTLASVFLVNFEGTRASLEAAYKYLLICSVGIAIAFLGTVLVYFADIQLFSDEVDALRWTTLLRVAPRLPPRVMELAFVFLVVGYGTKAGLVPMHTWLPDAHSEAPAPVSALMSGVLLAVGVYALLRFKPVVDLAAGPAFARRILLVLGVASMAVAALFLWTSQNFKRMLAYSSVEHIGIACLGLGFGGAWGVTGALLHLANHALAKSALFLLAGRIRAAYDSAEVLAVRGLLGPLPRTGGAFLAAMLALMGLPPFGLFTSEVMIFGAGFREGRVGVAAVGLVLLVLAFAGLLRTTQTMLHGVPARPPVHASRGAWPAVPVVVALLLLLLTGLAWPPGLARALDRIAAVVAG
ncbi:MAG: hydrogenase 4 subunit F [Candidatus Rokuibacteriota bacterium]|nr:MAG: hydrogenase 4 subunit F [Candidatus Rokubacteria bacterium]PYN65941.1 MAG: hydrogenase 4 subunit F [Candidatus Rokubacteria bacterium]